MTVHRIPSISVSEHGDDSDRERKNKARPSLMSIVKSAVRSRRAPSEIDYFDFSLWGRVLAVVNPKVSTLIGRITLMLAVIFFCAVAVVGIIVQIYTDVEMSNNRIMEAAHLRRANIIAGDVFDITLLLCDEMQVYYVNNNNEFDEFMEHAEKTMQKVDQKLIFNENWPTDFSGISEVNRANISSAAALKTAVQAIRLLRKAPNGTAEADIIRFYSNVIDNLMVAMQLVTQDAPRYAGWHNFLSTIRMIQSYVNFKRFAIVSVKLAKENRTVSSVSDPIYQSIISYYNAYNEFAEIAAVETDVVESYLRNLTDQESSKEVDFWKQYMFILDFATLNGDIWDDVSAKHAENIFWIIIQLRSMNNVFMRQFISSWPNAEIISAALLVVAIVPIHVYGTLRLQNQIKLYHTNLDVLEEAFTILYDCVPNAFEKKATIRDIMPVRTFKDTCVMIMDISNIYSLIASHDFNDIASFLSDFFFSIEVTLQKYNCFKVDIYGDCIALAAGVGEKHATDHCLEMIYAALDVRDVVSKMNEENDEDTTADLRIGLSIGACSTRIVYMQVPRMVVVGEAARAAAVMHGTCFPMKVQVSEAVFKRIGKTVDLDFTRRGIVRYSPKTSDITSYWVSWADENKYDENSDDAVSVASLTAAIDSMTQQHHQHHYSQHQNQEKF